MAQKWYEKASVQTVIVVGIFGIITLIVNDNLQAPKLKTNINTLENTITVQNNKILQLENELTPFKTLALEKYDEVTVNSLEKLANNYREMENKLNSIEATLKPREINNDQCNTITNSIAQYKDVTINFYTMLGDANASLISNKLKNCMTSSGWKIGEQIIPMGKAWQGIILFASGENPDEPISSLYKVLKSFEFETSIQQNNKLLRYACI